jgi:hypothetical protein
LFDYEEKELITKVMRVRVVRIAHFGVFVIERIVIVHIAGCRDYMNMIVVVVMDVVVVMVVMDVCVVGRHGRKRVSFSVLTDCRG